MAAPGTPHEHGVPEVLGSELQPAQPVPWPEPTRPRRAVAFPRADVPGAASVLALVAVFGLPVAWLWSRLAPTQLSLVQADGTLVALPPESQHRFDDLALFVVLGLAAGIVTGVGVWMLRRRRGPLTLLALTVGSVVAAWLAMRTGVSFADGRYADVVRAAAANSVVAVGPRLESGWIVVAQPLAAVLTYGVVAAVNGLDDLGRRLS